MIKGKVRKDYTLEEILECSSEYDIMRRYIGHDFKLGVPIESPFREDPTPSFSVTNRGGFLYFKDWGDDGCEGNLTEFLKKVFPNKSYGHILSQVAEDMGTRTLIHIASRGIKSPQRREPTIIQVTKRRFDTADLEYWKQYHITRKELEGNDEFEIVAIKNYRVNGKVIPLPITEMCFGYLFKNDNDFFWKIYRPFAKDRKDKWRFSGPNDHILGLNNIRGRGKAIGTKSLKDYIVMRKFIERTLSTQSEASESFNDVTVSYIQSEVVDMTDFFVNFDSDEPGIKASKALTHKFGFSHINVPNEYMPIKDFADLGKIHGLDAIEKQLILKNVI